MQAHGGGVLGRGQLDALGRVACACAQCGGARSFALAFFAAHCGSAALSPAEAVVVLEGVPLPWLCRRLLPWAAPSCAARAASLATVACTSTSALHVSLPINAHGPARCFAALHPTHHPRGCLSVLELVQPTASAWRRCWS